MKLKSPTDTPVHVALLSGQAMQIGPEGREVEPVFAKEAFAKGCIPVELTVEDMTDKDAVPTEREQSAILRATLRRLKAEDTPLTGAGLPNRNTVSATVGWNVSAVELTDAWNSL